MPTLSPCLSPIDMENWQSWNPCLALYVKLTYIDDHALGIPDEPQIEIRYSQTRQSP